MFLSLPSIAIESLFRMTDKNCSPIVTLGPKHEDIQKYFRQQINGGLGNCFVLITNESVSVFARHINLNNDQQFPVQTRFAPNGRKFTVNTFLDFK